MIRFRVVCFCENVAKGSGPDGKIRRIHSIELKPLDYESSCVHIWREGGKNTSKYKVGDIVTMDLVDDGGFIKEEHPEWYV